MPAFRFEEMPGSGNSTSQPPTIEKRYYASGSVDETFVMNMALAGTPSIIASAQGILYRQDIKLDWTAADYCVVTVPYAKTDRTLGSYEVHFSTAGGTAHITNSLSTVNRYPAGVAPDMKGAIDYDGDEVKGCEIIVPALKLSVAFRHPQGIITMERVKVLGRTTAYVNDDVFLTYAPGEVLFLGADGQWGPQTETSVRYEFACAENADGAKKLTFGDVADVVKQGHDFCWIRYKDEEAGGLPTRIPQHAYVERVYRRTSFVALFGFGG